MGNMVIAGGFLHDLAEALAKYFRATEMQLFKFLDILESSWWVQFAAA
jgi:hypothetical protein